jgi:hypothetical protein
MSNLLPAERRAADDALCLLREMPPTVSILYAELVRYQDGERAAGQQAFELVDTLSDQLKRLRQILRRLGGPE